MPVDEYFWEDLLLHMEERKVIPLVGPELLTVPDATQQQTLDQWLAGRLVKALQLPPAELSAGCGVNDVVALHARQRRPREEIYARIFSLLRTAAFEPPPALRTLAAIEDFGLHVSLTFDGLLHKALQAARPGAEVTSIAYRPSDPRDLAEPVSAATPPTVFHLFGKCSPSPDYVICDDDMIEFVHAMQSEHRRPKLLFHELQGKHLLVLGCSFDDWLSRFLLRIVRDTPFAENRRHRELVVDSLPPRNPALVMFLASYSANTQFVEGFTAETFIAELGRRWAAARPAAAARPQVDATGTAEAQEPTEGAVFLSYASEDRGTAQTIAAALRAAGVDVWFDKERLHAGDRWERIVRRQLERSSLFVPLLSSASLSDANRRSWFWVEWNEAAAFSKAMSPDEIFIVPVASDGVDPGSSGLPDAFSSSQIVELKGGQMPPEFAARVKTLVREYHRRRRGP